MKGMREGGGGGSVISSEQAGWFLTDSLAAVEWLCCCALCASLSFCLVFLGRVNDEGVGGCGSVVVVVVVVLVLPVSTTVQTCESPFNGCPGKPNSIRFHGWCYYVLEDIYGTKNITDWYKARDYCKSDSGELASPTDTMAIGMWFTWTKTEAWIGATDAEGSIWYFLDGRQVHCSAFNYQPPKPDPFRPLCGTMTIGSRKPFIAPTPCLKNYPVICERWVGFKP
ncbi:C-type lectin domain family 2 member L-like [Portunus trituberculatus]|uniref:C-type lectin domain family 2 member L-like n=1 Tax=Portunus trituberculatus TaxID=210409 RepID=UPI001E1CBB2E|nr:C-type lectin domain family 2 member L-like [Portunus trituberculatus]